MVIAGREGRVHRDRAGREAADGVALGGARGGVAVDGDRGDEADQFAADHVGGLVDVGGKVREDVRHGDGLSA
jgi:hypothetical protein